MTITIGTEASTAALMSEIATFYLRIWPGDPIDRLGRTVWAFMPNPQGAVPLVIARDSGRIVGVRGGIAWSLVGRRVAQLHGTAVDPSVRRQGLFRRMTEEFLQLAEADGNSFIFNVSVAESRAGYETMGWSYVDELHSLFLPLKPARLIRQLVGRSPKEAVLNRSVQEPPSFDDISPLIARRSGAMSCDAFTEYSEDFFKWRFTGLGHSWIGDPDRGYIVYRMRGRGALAELLVGDIWPGSASVSGLIRDAMREERPDLLASWTTVNHPAYRPLRRLGFLKQPGRELNLGIRPIGSSSQPELFALMAADIDTF